MKKITVLRTFGGLTVMLSVFLLLAVAINYSMLVDGAKYALGENEQLRQTSIVQTGRALPPRNVIEGFFDINRDGDLQTTGNKNGLEVVHHYRSIHADEIKSSDAKPVLKLQVYNDAVKSWKVTEITKIDNEDGNVYFLLKTQEDEQIIPHDYYTGTYQLIFQ